MQISWKKLIICVLFALLAYFAGTDLLSHSNGYVDFCDKGNFSCFKQAAMSGLGLESPSRVLDKLSDASRRDLISSNDCHLIVHEIGRRAASSMGLNKALSMGSHACRGGYFHGVLEYAAANNLLVPGTCTSNLNEYVRLNCLHGAGHGILVQSAYDVNESLLHCSLVASGADAGFCSGGVFMESFKPGHSEESPLDEKLTSPFEFCEKYGFEQYCYLYSGLSLLRRNGGNYSEAAEQCNRLEPEFAGVCSRGVGIFAARDLDYDSSRVLGACTSGSMNSNCALGAASDFGQSKRPINGAVFCLQLVPPLNAACFAEVLRGLWQHF